MILSDRLKQRAAGFSVLLHRALGDRHQRRIGILLHHRVCPRYSNMPFPPHAVTPAVFRSQLAGLQAAGYTFVRLAEVREAAASLSPLPRRSVVLTFDDVHASVYEYAFPIMRALGIPGTAFLATSFLDSQLPFPFDDWGLRFQDRLPPESYRPLSVTQCLQMRDSGLFDFGAHTHTHQDFRGRPHQFRQEVELSIKIIRDLFDQDEVPFAFPWGSVAHGYAGGELANAARQTKAYCALTTEGLTFDPHTHDRFDWGRFVVFEWDTPATLGAKLAGRYDWARRVRRTVGNRGELPVAPSV